MINIAWESDTGSHHVQEFTRSQWLEAARLISAIDLYVNLALDSVTSDDILELAEFLTYRTTLKI